MAPDDEGLQEIFGKEPCLAVRMSLRGLPSLFLWRGASDLWFGVPLAHPHFFSSEQTMKPAIYVK
jgi:hypothetical protein